jgi:catechol 2,3-dioxygenase-like lactoylglutathione lyase family enzyme
MRPRFDVITLAVASFERSLAFYRDGLGWPMAGVVASEFHDDLTGAGGAIAFLPLDNGLQIALYERDNLAKDAQLPLEPSGSPQFSLIHQVGSREEVDRVIGEAVAAGGRLTAAPRMRPFGFYSGYVQDPDGHLWEIGWNSRS